MMRSSVVVMSRTSDLVSHVVNAGATEVLVFGEQDDLVTGVTYWLRRGPIRKRFDWLVGDIEPTEVINYANEHHEYIGGVIVAGIREQASLSMSKIGFAPVGRLLGMVAWKRVSPPFGGLGNSSDTKPCTDCGRRRRTIAKTKKRVRRKVVRAPVDKAMASVPCVHRGSQIGTMLSGTGFVPVFGCKILSTCWYEQCRQCEQRQHA